MTTPRMSFLEQQEQRLCSQCYSAEQLGSDYPFEGNFIVDNALHDPKNISTNIHAADFHEYLDFLCSTSLDTQPEINSPKFKADLFNVDGNTT